MQAASLWLRLDSAVLSAARRRRIDYTSSMFADRMPESERARHRIRENLDVRYWSERYHRALWSLETGGASE